MLPSKPVVQWFDGGVASVSFVNQVLEKFHPLLTQSGFGLVDHNEHVVTLESSVLRVLAVFDPRGEVDVDVFPKQSAHSAGWSYTGLVGRASVARLLEIALEQMQADPRILGGDPDFYASLASERQADAEAWTAYYSRTGPRPRPAGGLP